MYNFRLIWLIGFLISIIVLFGIDQILNYFTKPLKPEKKPNAQEMHLIELNYSQLCSIKHLVIPTIVIALLAGAGGIFAVGYASQNFSTRYQIASIVFVSFSMAFIYYDVLYLSRKIRKYEEVLGIRKLLRKFKLPST